MRRPPLRACRILLLLILALGAGCVSLGNRPKPLRIGVRANAAPFSYRQSRQWQGIEIDLGRALADRLGRRPVFIALPPDDLVPALLEQRVDVLMAGLAVTEDLRVQIDFAPPYLASGQGVLVRRADLPRVPTLRSLRAAVARAAVIPDSTAEALLERYFPRASHHPFANLDYAVQALLNNRVDMILGDAPALWGQLRRHPDALGMAPVVFARQEIAWGFRHGNARLRQAAQLALDDWQRDGTLERILRDWLPVSP
ncbi:MAG: amino acid ABC transporter substrate-binding protein [Lentisphaerae bacterium]|jgi:polar amino acid transport system substrate-binding protein|nr:amino acid ABC transporter substrate-binding protein [Lentisphaerota bacterium]